MRDAFVVAGLAFGDEGKGATVDFICRTRDVKLVVRYNGGCQAGHNVVTPEGRHHTFSQFGSGSFIPGVRTHLSRFMLVNPLNMMREANDLAPDIWERTTVDAKCVIVTPFHCAVNRILSHGKHNTCGMGVGQARADHLREGNKVLFAGDLRDQETTKQKLRFLQQLAKAHVCNYGSFARVVCIEDFLEIDNPDAVDKLAALYAGWPAKIVDSFKLDEKENVVFEGAQGVLLDENFGEVGYNTWTCTTFDNAFHLLEESKWEGRVKKIGVMRTYLTRHGDGPLPTEDPKLDSLPEPHNDDNGFPGKFRRGRLDLKLIRHAVDILEGVDGIALNHCDQISVKAIPKSQDFGQPVVIRGHGPAAYDREWIYASAAAH
jgi:adenylosuccinate synthase